MAKNKPPVKRLVAQNAIRVLPIDKINFDPAYQRPVVRGHKAIITGFDKEALGTPLVGERPDGTLWGVDGQQRITALVKMGRTQVRCEVFKSEGPEHEARIFRIVNVARTRLTPLQVFHASITARNAESLAIKALCEEYGFHIPRYNSSPANTPPESLAAYVRAVDALQSVYRTKKEAGLRFVLDLLRDAWPDDPYRTRGVIFQALAQFWANRKANVDRQRLVDRLNTTTAHKLIYSAGLGVGSAVANVVVLLERIYNRRYKAAPGARKRGTKPAPVREAAGG
jgi:hypothetical protein